jgi:V/A-type H+-transporting ATPase subunit I
MTSSFFGIELDYDNPIRKVSLVQWLAEKKVAFHMNAKDEFYQSWNAKYPATKDITDPQELIRQGITFKNGDKSYDVLSQVSGHVLFELALLIGVVHIIMSYLRYINRNWAGIGWIAFMIGCVLYFAHYFQMPTFLNYVFGVPLEAGDIGFQLMIGGIIFACIASLIQNKWKGSLELMNMIQIFADIMSYTRLYALALAGAVMTTTIRDMTTALPAVLGIVLAIFAHLINLVLGTMSGVIHGLRLNFLEWYHYSFEGGGKKFRALKLFKHK